MMDPLSYLIGKTSEYTTPTDYYKIGDSQVMFGDKRWDRNTSLSDIAKTYDDPKKFMSDYYRAIGDYGNLYNLASGKGTPESYSHLMDTTLQYGGMYKDGTKWVTPQLIGDRVDRALNSTLSNTTDTYDFIKNLDSYNNNLSAGGAGWLSQPGMYVLDSKNYAPQEFGKLLSARQALMAGGYDPQEVDSVFRDYITKYDERRGINSQQDATNAAAMNSGWGIGGASFNSLAELGADPQFYQDFLKYYGPVYGAAAAITTGGLLGPVLGSGVLPATITGAAAGAAGGAASAYGSGNPDKAGDAAAQGAMSGALSGGVGGLVTPATGALVNAGVNNTVANALVSTAAGAGINAGNAAISGGDVGQAALGGAVGGLASGISKGIDTAFFDGKQLTAAQALEHGYTPEDILGAGFTRSQLDAAVNPSLFDQMTPTLGQFTGSTVKAIGDLALGKDPTMVAIDWGAYNLTPAFNNLLGINNFGSLYNVARPAIAATLRNTPTRGGYPQLTNTFPNSLNPAIGQGGVVNALTKKPASVTSNASRMGVSLPNAPGWAPNFETLGAIPLPGINPQIGIQNALLSKFR